MNALNATIGLCITIRHEKSGSVDAIPTYHEVVCVITSFMNLVKITMRDC